MRMTFTAPEPADSLAAAFGAQVGERFGMDWRLADASVPKRGVGLVSREEHCLLDLLWRARRGDLTCEIPLVISNHAEHRVDVEGFGVRYEHVPAGADAAARARSEERLLELLGGGDFDLVVLARYMQILSPGFLDALGLPVINIHHSFLPAFPGAQPYRRARERGVKVIGATAHYVTEELDAGPIIEQDVARVTHRESVAELERIGRDIERSVLARAVALHLEDRVLVHGGRTVVF
jgi:formyltetrahydrofolate deformylase